MKKWNKLKTYTHRIYRMITKTASIFHIQKEASISKLWSFVKAPINSAKSFITGSAPASQVGRSAAPEQTRRGFSFLRGRVGTTLGVAGVAAGGVGTYNKYVNNMSGQNQQQLPSLPNNGLDSLPKHYQDLPQPNYYT